MVNDDLLVPMATRPPTHFRAPGVGEVGGGPAFENAELYCPR